MKKRVIPLLLALAMLCALLPQAALTASAEVYSGSCGANLTWSFDTETGLLTITGSGAMADYYSGAPWHDHREAITAVSLPEGLTSISDRAFNACSSLTSVTIPDSVTSIGYGAFDGTAYYNDSNNWDGQLLYIGSWLIKAKKETESAEIKQGTTGIAGEAFRGCSALTSVTIPASVTSIGDFAFFDCSALTGVIIPASVTGIGGAAFYGCSALTSVTIPDSVTSIGYSAFKGCSALTSVTIPDSVTSIGRGAFSGTAYYNDSNNWDGQLLYIGSWLIAAKEEIESADIKQGTTGIADAFYSCSALTSVTIPEGVTSIGGAAFWGCSALTSVTIPASVTSIGGGAFWGCSALTSVTIPEGVTSIGDSAFSYCRALTSVTIPDGVTSIGDWAFCDCDALTGVTIPPSVTSIGDKAFGYYYDYDYGYQKIDGFTIYGYPGTAAESYATENGFSFVPLEGFSDVALSDYFFSPVMWATTHEPPITAGVAPGYFGPNNPCTREQIVTFLWAVYGKPEPNVTGRTFSDVAAGAWYYKPVMWAIEYNFTSGMPDGSFGVGQPCTRAQAMTFLWASKGKPAPSSMESTFSDVSSSDWFCKPILWAAENGITKGVGDGLFGVNNTCTRAQILTFLYKAYN